MFTQIEVQVLSQDPRTTGDWTTIYTSGLPDKATAEWDAKREIAWVKRNPEQYLEPIGVRAIIAGEPRFEESLWTS
jgi:hypothetical protein